MQSPNMPMGGSEILYTRLLKLVDVSSINLILSICHPSLLSSDKPNVLWQHLNHNEENVALLADQNFVNRLDAIVFVSHWQHEKFRKRFPLDSVRCYVIQNAVDWLKPVEKPEKIKLIYTSTPWRGLNVFVEVLKKLDRDVDVEIYSGTSIYGPQFHESVKDRFQDLYDDINRIGVRRIEYAPNSLVRNAVRSSHILAYPSTFEETSCLAAIEALSDGCKVVTTNFGALYETCGVWADYVPISNDLVERYTKVLRENIDQYWNKKEERFEQQEHYKKYWSWDARSHQWKKLIEEINDGKSNNYT